MSKSKFLKNFALSIYSLGRSPLSITPLTDDGGFVVVVHQKDGDEQNIRKMAVRIRCYATADGRLTTEVESAKGVVIHRIETNGYIPPELRLES